MQLKLKSYVEYSSVFEYSGVLFSLEKIQKCTPLLNHGPQAMAPLPPSPPLPAMALAMHLLTPHKLSGHVS